MRTVRLKSEEGKIDRLIFIERIKGTLGYTVSVSKIGGGERYRENVGSIWTDGGEYDNNGEYRRKPRGFWSAFSRESGIEGQRFEKLSDAARHIEAMTRPKPVEEPKGEAMDFDFSAPIPEPRDIKTIHTEELKAILHDIRVNNPHGARDFQIEVIEAELKRRDYERIHYQRTNGTIRATDVCPNCGQVSLLDAKYAVHVDMWHDMRVCSTCHAAFFPGYPIDMKRASRV